MMACHLELYLASTCGIELNVINDKYGDRKDTEIILWRTSKDFLKEHKASKY